MLSGCADGAHCGTFSRVAANCASGDYCPGGRHAHGDTDPSLCAGAPVYQHGGADGPVLLRFSNGFRWEVCPSTALLNCERGMDGCYLASPSDDQPSGGPPNAVAYRMGINEDMGTGWIDFDARPSCQSGCGINVACVDGDSACQHAFCASTCQHGSCGGSGTTCACTDGYTGAHCEVTLT